jgi:hypothetical protein
MMPNSNPPVSAEEVQRLFHYDEATGALSWKVCLSTRAKAGRICSYSDKRGYIYVKIHKRHYMVHRVIWAVYHGAWPTNDIDHINGNPSDNRISNLRPATRSQNLCNKKLSSRNTSGIKGVNWHKKARKWRGRVILNKRYYNAGYFDDPAEAGRAVQSLREKIHGEFANHL